MPLVPAGTTGANEAREARTEPREARSEPRVARSEPRVDTAASRTYIRIGLGTTLFWFAVAAVYVQNEIGWLQLLHLPADTLGDFLNGVFAPLAFLWLVVGYFLQQAEIHQNTEALRAQAVEIQRTAEQAVIQSEAIAANEVHARQETFLRISELVKGQLGTIMGMLWVSSQGAVGNGAVSGEEQSRMWNQLSARDSEVFSRRMIETHLRTPAEERYALFYGTPVRARHSNHFISTFDRLLQRASDCDPEGLIRGALRYGAHGLVYDLCVAFRKQAPPELSDPSLTGTHITMAAMPGPGATPADASSS